MSQPNPWAVTELDPNLVVRLANTIPPCDRAVELDVLLVGDPHQEDDEGHVWTRLSAARQVADVAPGAVVLLGSNIGRYLATDVAWDFEVDPDDPIVFPRSPADPPERRRAAPGEEPHAGLAPRFSPKRFGRYLRRANCCPQEYPGRLAR